jgi:molybdopterin/thiamine biosynthesis adenylyltransferase
LEDQNVLIVDDLKNQIEELVEIQGYHNLPLELKGKPDSVWIYYPWSNHLVHSLNDPYFSLVRHSRNQNLLSMDEQSSLKDKRVGIAGLNVGNPAAICMVLESVARHAKFADNDILSLSNLNRFRARLSDLGMNKAALSARQAFEINPFMEIEVLENGIQPNTMKDFLLNPRIDVLVEEMDNLPLKILIREEAKQAKIPVVMVTGNGANVIVDVERYDNEPELPIMNGYLKTEIISKSKSPDLKYMNQKEKVLLARDFMGAKYLTKRLQESFQEIGESLVGIPQLAESSFLRGAAVCYVVREILLGAKMESGRYFLELESLQDSKRVYDA